MDRYKCPCAYIYDETKGCAEFKNPSGTMFQELPDGWTCPRCGYEKEFFRKLEADKEDLMMKSGQGGVMAIHDVVVFRSYPFEVGQKIHIEGGLRGGDWEVVGVTDGTVKLKCPISFKEFEWKRFCYFVEEQQDREWPQKD